MEDEQICSDIVSTVCQSPVIRIDAIRNKYGLQCDLIAKCEFFNYGNCIESRLCDEFLSNLEENGKIDSNSTIICKINIPLLLACRIKGYKCVAICDECNSSNREIINLTKALGVELIDNICLKKAKNLFPNAFVIDEIIAEESILRILKEIIEACDYDIDLLVVRQHLYDAVNEHINSWIPYCKVVGFVISEEEDYSDEQLIIVNKEEATKMTKILIAKEGLLCGIDSGAAVVAAIKSAKELDEQQKCVVLLAEGIFNFMHNLAIDGYSLREKARKENKSDAWLWQTSVQNLATNMSRPIITGNSKCSEVVRLMKKQSIKQVAVLSNKDSSLIGIVTASDILDKITSGCVDNDSPIQMCSRKDYAAINSHESVGKLIFLLENNPFVVIVDYVESESQRFIGLMTQVDALNFFSFSTFSGK